MTYDEFEPLFVMLVEEKKTQDRFFEHLPFSIAKAFCANEYTDSLERQVSFLLDALIIDNELIEDVNTFLFGFELSGVVIPETLEGKLAYFKEKYFHEES